MESADARKEINCTIVKILSEKQLTKKQTSSKLRDMLVIVNYVKGQVIKKLHDAGWRVHEDFPCERDDKTLWRLHRIICGLHMSKNFETLGDAMWDFERVTGYDVIGSSNHDGEPDIWFGCVETQTCVGGWECGQYMFKNWLPTPRKCLELMNKLEN